MGQQPINCVVGLYLDPFLKMSQKILSIANDGLPVWGRHLIDAPITWCRRLRVEWTAMFS